MSFHHFQQFFRDLSKTCRFPGRTGRESINEHLSSLTVQMWGVNQTDDPDSRFDASEEKSQGGLRAANPITWLHLWYVKVDGSTGESTATSTYSIENMDYILHWLLHLLYITAEHSTRHATVSCILVCNALLQFQHVIKSVWSSLKFLELYLNVLSGFVVSYSTVHYYCAEFSVCCITM